MNRFTGLVLVSMLFASGVVARSNDSGSGSDSNSDSGSGSNESGSHGHGHGHSKHGRTPPSYNPGYNYPVYVPQGPPPPYGGYYPMPVMMGYPQQQPQIYPANPYPYGGYYNQAPPPPPGQPMPYPMAAQGPAAPNQNDQGYPGIPGGTSSINHSLKVNKEYKEDGHHYRPDGTPTN